MWVNLLKVHKSDIKMLLVNVKKNAKRKKKEKKKKMIFRDLPT